MNGPKVGSSSKESDDGQWMDPGGTLSFPSVFVGKTFVNSLTTSGWKKLDGC